MHISAKEFAKVPRGGFITVGMHQFQEAVSHGFHQVTVYPDHAEMRRDYPEGVLLTAPIGKRQS